MIPVKPSQKEVEEHMGVYENPLVSQSQLELILIFRHVLKFIVLLLTNDGTEDPRKCRGSLTTLCQFSLVILGRPAEVS